MMLALREDADLYVLLQQARVRARGDAGPAGETQAFLEVCGA